MSGNWAHTEVQSGRDSGSRTSPKHAAEPGFQPPRRIHVPSRASDLLVTLGLGAGALRDLRPEVDERDGEREGTRGSSPARRLTVGRSEAW